MVVIVTRLWTHQNGTLKELVYFSTKIIDTQHRFVIVFLSGGRPSKHSNLMLKASFNFTPENFPVHFYDI